MEEMIKLDRVITPNNPMYQMLYRQCPGNVANGIKEYTFELCDGLVIIRGEWAVWPEAFTISYMSMRYNGKTPEHDITHVFIGDDVVAR